MKQISLKLNGGAACGPYVAPCTGRLAFTWGVYGLVMALLWWALPRSPLTDAAAWLVALASGLILVGWTTEV